MPELAVERKPYYNASEIRERVDLRALHATMGKSANGHTIVSSGQKAVVVECVFHNDTSPSLFLFYEAGDPHFHCFACGAHGDCFDYVQRLQRCSFADAVGWIVDRGLAGYIYDPSAQPRLPAPKSMGSDGKNLVLRNKQKFEHLYRDELGKPFSKLIRVYGDDENNERRKVLSRRHPDPHVSGACKDCVAFWDKRDDRPSNSMNYHPNGWGYGDRTERSIPYRLPEVLAAEGKTIIFPEGEKCVDAGESIGFVGSTNPNGSGFRFPPEWPLYFSRVGGLLFLPDPDVEGRLAALRRYAWARQHGIPASYCDIYRDQWKKWDIADDIERGMTYKEARDLIQESSRVTLLSVSVTDEVKGPTRDGNSLFVPLTEKDVRFALAHPLKEMTMPRDAKEVTNTRTVDLVGVATDILSERGALQRLTLVPPLEM